MKPFWLFALTGLGAALGLALLLSIFFPAISAWLLAINIVAILLYRYDKMIAGSSRTRVPELVLLLTEAVGGTLGAALAMWAMRPRHKTRSADFLAKFFLVLALQMTVVFILLRSYGNFWPQ